MKGIKLLVAAILVISPFAAQADLITHTINFNDYNGNENGTGTDGAFLYSGLKTDNSGGNCPDDAANNVAPRCAKLNTNSLLTFWLPEYATFNLVDFWWRSTGKQENSNLVVSWRNVAGEWIKNHLGNSNGDTVEQVVNLSGITGVSFSNSEDPDYKGKSVYRIDNLTFSYTCEGSDCVSVPEPGTLALLGMGLLGMGLSRRRKKAV